MDKHITLVAVINIAFGALGIMIAFFVLIGIIIAFVAADDPVPRSVVPIAGMAVIGFFLITSLPEIIGGFGLLKRKRWARTLILIVACLDLIFIPIGTVIGIYELWVLLQDETARLFEG
jgi:hypothetical protein